MSHAAVLRDLVVRVAGVSDVGSLATLRSLWTTGNDADPDLERRLAQALTFYGRAGFIPADDRAGNDLLLVRSQVGS